MSSPALVPRFNLLCKEVLHHHRIPIGLVQRSVPTIDMPEQAYYGKRNTRFSTEYLVLVDVGFLLEG